jgi:hypothetical protein
MNAMLFKKQACIVITSGRHLQLPELKSLSLGLSQSPKIQMLIENPYAESTLKRGILVFGKDLKNEVNQNCKWFDCCEKKK